MGKRLSSEAKLTIKNLTYKEIKMPSYQVVPFLDFERSSSYDEIKNISVHVVAVDSCIAAELVAESDFYGHQSVLSLFDFRCFVAPSDAKNLDDFTEHRVSAHSDVYFVSRSY